MLRFKNSRGNARRLLRPCCRRFGLSSFAPCLRHCQRARRETRQDAYRQRRNRPRATAYSLPSALGSHPGPAATKTASAIRIVHSIRHADPESNSGFPYSENLPMGMSAESSDNAQRNTQFPGMRLWPIIGQPRSVPRVTDNTSFETGVGLDLAPVYRGLPRIPQEILKDRTWRKSKSEGQKPSYHRPHARLM